MKTATNNYSKEYNFSGFFDEYSSEEQHLSEIQLFCNIINVFITFDQFKASLLNKSIHLYPPTPPPPQKKQQQLNCFKYL